MKYPYDVMITTEGKTYCGESDWYKSSAMRRFNYEKNRRENDKVEILQNGKVVISHIPAK